MVSVLHQCYPVDYAVHMMQNSLFCPPVKRLVGMHRSFLCARQHQGKGACLMASECSHFTSHFIDYDCFWADE